MQSQRSSTTRDLPASKKSSTTSKLSKPVQTETPRNRSAGNITNQVTVKKPGKKSSPKPVNKTAASDSKVPKRETENVNKKNNNAVPKASNREDSDYSSYYYDDTATFTQSKKKEGAIGECPNLRKNGTFPPFLKHGMKCSDNNANRRVSMQSQQRSTPRIRSRVSFDDDIDSNDDAELRQERDAQRIMKKMRNLVIVMANDARTDIAPIKTTASSIDTGAQRFVGSHRIGEDGNFVPVTDTTVLRSGSFPTIGHRRLLNFPPFPTFRPTIVPQNQRDSFIYSETYAPLGEDLGIFSNTAIADFIAKLLKGDPDEHPEIPDNCGEGTSSFIVAAYNILISLLDYIFQLFGYEKHLEPKEDFVRYNGYKIKVFGGVLLLESVHVNRDYQIDCKSGCSYRSLQSLLPFEPHTLSTETIREESLLGDVVREGRVRIVVRITGSAGAELEETGSVSGHYIKRACGKWTFFLNKNLEEHGTFKEKADKENFVEIVCPTGVHPETIEYAMLNGLLYIDAP